jgi:hypothetical protein
MTRQLSGPAWVDQFPDAKTIDALADDFRPGCQAFIDAMRAGGANVLVNSTRRPQERTYALCMAHI